MHAIIALLVVAALVALVVAPGAFISSRRSDDPHRAVIEHSTSTTRVILPREVDEPPLDPVERDWWEAARRYESAMAAAHRRAADGIGRALERFAAAGGIQVPRAHPLASVEIALLRLQVGVREPVSAAVDRVNAGTMEWDTGELRRLLDMEDQAARTA